MISLLFFSGCSFSDLSGSDTKTSGWSSSSGEKVDKYSGVELTFSENNPPSTVYKGQKFNFGFIWQNNHDTDIEGLSLKVSGFDKSYVNGLDYSYSIPKISKATENSGKGVLADFVITDVSIEDFEKQYLFNAKFQYCYKASTRYVKQICIPSQKTNKCDSESDSYQYENGVLGVSIKDIVNHDSSIRIILEISNKNSGKVRDECFLEKYAPSFEIEAVLGSQSGTCSMQSEKLQFINNKAVVYCDFSRSNEESYNSQLEVKLSYLYEKEIIKKITAKDFNN